MALVRCWTCVAGAVGGYFGYLLARRSHRNAKHHKKAPLNPACRPHGNGISSKPIFLAHIHKAGGTTLCTLAIANGLCTPQPQDTMQDRTSWFSKNCNPAFADRDAASGYLGGRRLLAYAQRRRIRFLANEYAMPAAMPWNALTVVALVRDPLHLTLTLCSEWREPHVEPLAPGMPRTDASASVAMLRECVRNEPMRNYQVRRYAGCWALSWEACHDKNERKAAAMGERHLRRALRFLERASLVLVTERLGEAGPLIARVLDWRATDTAALRAGRRRFAYHATHSAHSDVNRTRLEGYLAEVAGAALLHGVREATALDRALHAHAVQRFDRNLRESMSVAQLPPGRAPGAERRTQHSRLQRMVKPTY